MQALFLLFWVLNVPYGIIEPLYTNRHRELLRVRWSNPLSEAIYEINLKIAPLQLNKSQYLSRIEGSPPKRKPRHSPKGKNEKQLSVRIYSEKCQRWQQSIPQIGERSNVTKSKKSVDWQLEKELIILYMAEGKNPRNPVKSRVCGMCRHSSAG